MSEATNGAAAPELRSAVMKPGGRRAVVDAAIAADLPSNRDPANDSPQGESCGMIVV